MSRIGKKPITIPAGVEVKNENNLLTVKKGDAELSLQLHPQITVEIKDGIINVDRPDDKKETRALHGLMRSMINNMVVGVSEGFKKTLDINGIGYKASKEGNELVLNVGLSHPVRYEEPKGIVIEVPKPNKIIISGADKQLVGETAAKIRRVRPPEPYKGKGIKYDYETVRLKVGKTGSK